MTFENTTLGQYFTDVVKDIGDVDLYGRCENYLKQSADGNRTIPDAILVITAGVDVQEDRLEAEIVGWGLGRESWGLGYKVAFGNTSLEDVWVEMHDWLAQTFIRDGKPMHMNLVFIDSGFRTERVHEFSAKYGAGWLVPCKGFGSQARHVVEVSSKLHPDRGTFFATIDTFKAKSSVFNQLDNAEPGYGHSHFPELDGEYDEEYFNQLKAEKRVRVKKNNQWRQEFIKTRDRNEALDCRVYAFAATIQLQNRRIVNFFPKSDRAAA